MPKCRIWCNYFLWFYVFCFWYKAKPLIKVYLTSYTHKQKYAQTASQGLDAYLLLFCINSFSLLALEVWAERIEGQYPFFANSQWGSDIGKDELWSIFLNVYSISKSEFWQRLGVILHISVVGLKANRYGPKATKLQFRFYRLFN